MPKNTKVVESEVESAVEDLNEAADEMSNLSEEEEKPAKATKPKGKAASPAKGKATSPKKETKGKAASPAKGKATSPKKETKGKAASPKKDTKKMSLLDTITSALTKSKREGGFYNVETEKVHTKSAAAVKEYVFYTLGDEGELRIAGTADSDTLTNALEELGYPDAEPDTIEEKEKKAKSKTAPKPKATTKGGKAAFTFTESELRKFLAEFSKKLAENMLASLKETAEETEKVEEEAPKKEKKEKKVKEPEPVSEEEGEGEPVAAASESEKEEEETTPKAKHYPITLDKELGLFVDKNQFVFDGDGDKPCVIGKVNGKKVVPLTSSDLKVVEETALRCWQVVKGKRDAKKVMTQKEVDEQVKLAKESLKGKRVKASEAESDEEGPEEGGDDGKTSEVVEEEKNESTDVDEEAHAKADAIKAKNAEKEAKTTKTDPVEAAQRIQSQVLDKPAEVTKDEFKKVYAIKMAGKIPLAQTQKVADAAGISVEKVKSIAINFVALSKKYPDVAAAKPSTNPPKARLDDEPAAAKAAPTSPKKLQGKN